MLEQEGLAGVMVGFPLLLIPLAIYNIIVFLMPGVSLAEPVVKLTLMSGAEWQVTLSDMLLALGVLLLLLEVIKGARPGAKYLTDHILALVIFGGAAAEFVMWPRFGTSTYFLLAMLALVDFISGIALRARRGTQVAPAAVVSKRERREPAASEPQFVPAAAPEPSVAAAPVAEHVPADRTEPKMHSDVAPNAPSPEVPSPELQPGSNSPAHPDTPPR